MIHAKFELTDHQIEQLKSALDAAKKAHDEDETSRGMVLLRLDNQTPSEAVFLPHKYSTKIREIMEDFKKESKS